MNRNFFIRLAFATHRVADILPQGEQITKEIREGANTILADLILLTDKETTRVEKKGILVLQLERQIDILLVYLDRAKKESWVDSNNFSLLEGEYAKIRELLEIFEGIQGQGKEQKEKELFDVLGPQVSGSRQVTPNRERMESAQDASLGHNKVNSPQFEDLSWKTKVQEKSVLTQRQKRIIEFLRIKENAQVWELQKVLPEVTKRTLRRDLDELLQKNLVERKGAWNAVSYELK